MGIVGSPRSKGNTDTLVDAVLASAEENGALVRKMNLRDLTIKPCNACDSCRKQGRCIHDDDMQDLLMQMEKADIWVLGTPVYWWGPTTQMKAFIDRWYGVSQNLFQGKRLALVIPMGGGNDFYSRHIIGMFEDISHYLGIEFFGSLIAPSLTSKNSASENSSLLERAKDFGMIILDTHDYSDEKAKSSAL